MDRVCHFEIPYENRDRVSAFYEKVFGWQIQHMEHMPYSFCITTPTDETMSPVKPGGINGGMYARDGEGGATSPVVVIEVESCSQRANDVTAAGGSTIVPPVEVGGGMGIYAQVKDSEGNIIGLWQPLQR